MGKASTTTTRSKRSFTAEGAAALRAAGHLEPDPVRRNPDHLAVRFLSPAIRLRVTVPPVRRLTLWTVDRMLHGGYQFITARTKHMDQVVRDEVRAGARQVVILGAGADSRAYRLDGELAGAIVFELDHPLMSEWKQRRVRALFGELPGHVRYVPVDFDSQPIEGALTALDAGRPALFVWEGVAPYLSRPAIDSILATVGRCAEGSSIVFDYVYADAVRTSPGRFRSYLRKLGEPLVSGLDPDTLAETLGAHGLELVSHARPDDLRRLHLGGAGPILSFSAIAHARRVTH